VSDQFEFEPESDEHEDHQADAEWVASDRDEDVDEGYSPDTARASETEFAVDPGRDEDEKSFEQRLEQEEPEIEDDWEEKEGSASGPDQPAPTALFPPVEPYQHGLLEVGDGQQIYWEECGNPDGKPVVFLHGGPGGGSTPTARRLYDPSRYRIVLYDQRGCGKSLPHASSSEADLAVNTTWHLVADLERLREDRGIDRWMVSGGSWGSALALAYAEEHPHRVTELVLRGIFTLRRAELDWYYNGGAGHLHPERYEQFLKPIGGHGFTGDAIAAYAELLFDPDPAVNVPAAVAWSTWEAATITMAEDPDLVADSADPTFAVAFARIENHYFTHGGWFREGQLIAGAHRLKGIPGVIIQGRYDVATPAVTAWDLHRAWPEADLRMVLTGHAGTLGEPAILEALVNATDGYAATGPA
jgi:proline iminopeptidase